MMVDTPSLQLVSIAVLFFFVGILFFYIGLRKHYHYHQELEKEINNLFLVMHTLLLVREKDIYRPEKVQEVGFFTKKKFFTQKDFSLLALQNFHTQLYKDAIYLTNLLDVSVKDIAGAMPYTPFFRFYLLFGFIFLIAGSLILIY